MSGGHTGLHCPKCGTVGHVHGFKAFHLNVVLKCPKCSTKWKTPSEICPKCGKPNGFAAPGLCSSCYSEKQSLK